MCISAGPRHGDNMRLEHSKMRQQHNLVRDFWALDMSQRRELCVRLGLITQEQIKLAPGEMERYKGMWARMGSPGNEGLRDAFAAAVQHETEQNQPATKREQQMKFRIDVFFVANNKHEYLQFEHVVNENDIERGNVLPELIEAARLRVERTHDTRQLSQFQVSWQRLDKQAGQLMFEQWQSSLPSDARHVWHGIETYERLAWQALANTWKPPETSYDRRPVYHG